MPLNLDNCNWTLHTGIDPNHRAYVMELPHAMLTVKFDANEPSPRDYHIEVALSPANGTDLAWPSKVLEATSPEKTLRDAQIKSLELLNQYIIEIQTEVKEHLKATITGP
ncbi:MAG: hypothetical protein HDQ88_08890 [Clostridia bacterium]|nr:hypothetical protein [Clostridia bacterium]